PGSADWFHDWELRCPSQRGLAYFYNEFGRTLTSDPRAVALDLGGLIIPEAPGVIPVSESAVTNSAETVAYTEKPWWRMLPLNLSTWLFDFPRGYSELKVPLDGGGRFTPLRWPHRTGLNQL